MVRINKMTGINAPAIGSANRKRTSRSSTATKNDQVHVSDTSTLREKAKILLSNMSEVRIERIEDIRNALENGNYQINEQDIAVQIVSNAMGEKPW